MIVGGETAGLAEYVHRGGRWLFTHTEIDPSHEGEGLGSVLARAALDHVAAGEQVVPLCPFITGWLERHSDYDRLVDHPFTEAVLRSQA
ncbi:MAG: N-acetyltransferase [Actinobacteria bacterium]|nr:N-acetyltransferase [Actinomycetota bacterium]